MSSNSVVNFEGSLLSELYRSMLRIRLFEEQTQKLKEAGEIPGSIHLAIGQEAIPVGFCRGLHISDLVGATYRGHGWALAKGVPAEAIFAEMMGRESKLNGGRAGSPFFSSSTNGFLGENSIVGGGVPIAAGAALSARNAEDGRVVITSFGDGAMNQGVVLETINLAVVMSLPLVFVVENNVYSEMTPISAMMRGESLASRAAGFGIHSYSVDGNDPLEVINVAQDSINRARQGNGPTFVEAHTIRLAGHYSGDAQQYRQVTELRDAWENEPLARMRRTADQSTNDFYDTIHEEVAVEIQVALAKARNFSDPDPSTARRHVYG